MGQNCVINTLRQGRDPQTHLWELSLTEKWRGWWGWDQSRNGSRGVGVATGTLLRLKSYENLAPNLDLSFPTPSPYSVFHFPGQNEHLMFSQKSAN